MTWKCPVRGSRSTTPSRMCPRLPSGGGLAFGTRDLQGLEIQAQALLIGEVEDLSFLGSEGSSELVVLFVSEPDRIFGTSELVVEHHANQGSPDGADSTRALF